MLWVLKRTVSMRLWVLKRTILMRQSFEHPKQMLKLMTTNVFKTLPSNTLSGSMKSMSCFFNGVLA